MKINIYLFIGALFGLTSVMLGAYVDHADLDVSAKALGSLQTAVRYQQLYAGLVCVMALLLPFGHTKGWLKLTMIIFILGIILFCGGIYAGHLLGIPSAINVAPFGGTLFMLGWCSLMISAFRSSTV